MNIRAKFLRVYYPFVYITAVVLMTSAFMSYRAPIHGFAWLPCFGQKFESRMTRDFKLNSGYTTVRDWGYDGQFYAQLAIDPFILNPETKNAFDNFQFRARRPLFAMTAYVAGGGKPRAILQAYSTQNLVFWLALACILLKWLPPTCWQNTLRYVCILYSFGLINSIQFALLDGPAMTMIALAVLLAEWNKPWMSALVLGLAGIGKETSILASSLFGLPKNFEPRQILSLALKLSLVVLPLAGWLFYLSLLDTTPNARALGSNRNFSWPLIGWWTAIQGLHAKILAGQNLKLSLTTGAFLLALPVQAVALLAMRRPSSFWWRVGSVYAVFSFFIGYATWEGLVGSAARLCMPVTVAFNILAPRTFKWLIILAVGNLTTVLGIHAMIQNGPPPQYRASASRSSLLSDMTWKSGWYEYEYNLRNYWRWSGGDAAIRIFNRETEVIQAVLRFKSRSVAPMEIEISNDEGLVQRFEANLRYGQKTEVNLSLKPGDNFLFFRPSIPVLQVPGDNRPLSFMLFNPTLDKE